MTDTTTKHECPCLSLHYQGKDIFTRSTGSPEGKYWAEKLGDEGREYQNAEAFTLGKPGLTNTGLKYAHAFPGCDETFVHSEADLLRMEHQGAAIQYEGEAPRPRFGVGNMFIKKG